MSGIDPLHEQWNAVKSGMAGAAPADTFYVQTVGSI